MLTGFIRARLRPYRSRVVLITALQSVQTVCILLLPAMNALIVDEGVVEGSRHVIVTAGTAMVLVTLLQVATAIPAQRAAAAVCAGLGRDLREQIFGRVLDLSSRELSRFGTPSLITRTVNDVKQVQQFTLTLFDAALSTVVLSIGGVVLAVAQDLWLGLLLVAMFLVVCTGITVMVARMAPLYDRLQSGIDLITRILREQIGGVRVVRAYVQHHREYNRFAAANKVIFGPSLRVGRLMTGFVATVTLVTNTFMIALVWFGGHRVDSGDLRIGELSALIGYLTLIVLAMVMVLVIVTGLSRARPSARRIEEVLRTAEGGPEPRAAPDPPRRPAPGITGPGRTSGGGRWPGAGRLELRHVRFGHPGSEAPVVNDVSLVAQPAETVALFGGTGSGKSTLLGLVLGRFDVTGGEILLDGRDVRRIPAAERSRLVGTVPQIVQLFSGTVRENLLFAQPDADDEQLWQALRTAQAADFVSELPDGLDSRLAQRGRSLSGGQRQRLTIARALLRRPRILLLDDCFSALDTATEARLRAALRTELAGTTVVLTSQRIGTVRDAERIVVLDAGGVVGTGTHDQLIRDSEVYRELVRSQPAEATTLLDLEG